MIDLKFVSRKMLIPSVLFIVVIIAASIINAANGISNSLFDYVLNVRGGGSAGMMVLLFGVIPLFAIVLPLMMDQVEREMIVLRIKQKRKLFYGYFAFSVMASAFLTILIVLGGLIGSYIFTGHIDNLWGTKDGSIYFYLENKNYFQFYIPQVTSVKVWAYIISSRFLAILFIASFVLFLKAILKKNIYVFFTALVVLGTDSFLPGKFSLLLGRARVELETWITPEEQLFNLVYFVLGIVILFFVCVKIYDKKEFYE